MCDVIQMLDTALRLSDRELQALQHDEFEEMERLAFERGVLIREAVTSPLPGDRTGYLARLEALRDVQVFLITEARKRRDSICAGLRQSRLQRQRIGGYHNAVQHALQ